MNVDGSKELLQLLEKVGDVKSFKRDLGQYVEAKEAADASRAALEGDKRYIKEEQRVLEEQHGMLDRRTADLDKRQAAVVYKEERIKRAYDLLK